jgi:acetyl esterase/lipase
MNEPLVSPEPLKGLKGLAMRAFRASLHLSPRPMALLIRRQFAKGTEQRKQKQLSQAPSGVLAYIDERYDTARKALLDVYVPSSTQAAGATLPAIVWTHGGGFVGGSKEELAGYFRMLAGAGFTVVGINYSLAPEAKYPTPVLQLMTALRYLESHSDQLHVDASRFVLAGDSAGAQISAQLAAAITKPEYGNQIGVEPLIVAEQIKGVALCCGIYDLSDLNESSPLHDFLKACGWSYSGVRDYSHDYQFIDSMSVAQHVSNKFPRTFITAGNADPLAPQSANLAATLRMNGVDVETLFFASDHRPPLGHEYQFDLDLGDANMAMERLIAFFRRCTQSNHH